MKDRSPLSKFEVNAQYPTYESYFLQKYSGAVNFVYNKEQKLLKVKLISSNLNFFRSGVNYKKSQAERKDGRESVIEMIPELTNRHPLPASLYIQTKFLPTVLHRINRLLCARDIISQMSQGSLWGDLKFGKSVSNKYPCLKIRVNCLRHKIMSIYREEGLHGRIFVSY